MKKRNALLILTSFWLLAICVPAHASVVSSETVQNIAAQYQKSVVEIQTHVKYPSGRTERSLGTGFFIDKEGHILTASHVVYDDEDLKVEAVDGFSGVAELKKKTTDKTYKYWVVFNEKKYSAHFVGSNRYVDIAILKLDEMPTDEFFSAVLGDSDAVQVGEFVMAMGSPLGLTSSVSSGIVSALHRRGGDLWFIEDFIQTDAPINPGNSGGPLINEKGEVIGINDAGYREADGLSFAVPIKFVAEYLERMKKEGDLKIGFFGAKTLVKNFPRTGGFEDINRFNDLLGWDNLSDLTLISEISKTRSAIVTEIKNDSPVQKSGMKVGDVITEFNGHQVNDTFDLRVAMLKTGPDKEIPVKVIRIFKGKQEEMTLSVKLIDPLLLSEENNKHH